MRKLQNTLYVTTPMAYLSLDGETIVIQNEDELLGRIPLLNLENIVSFGYRGASPRLMGACAERGIGLCFFDAERSVFGACFRTRQRQCAASHRAISHCWY